MTDREKAARAEAAEALRELALQYRNHAKEFLRRFEEESAKAEETEAQMRLYAVKEEVQKEAT